MLRNAAIPVCILALSACSGKSDLPDSETVGADSAMTDATADLTLPDLVPEETAADRASDPIDPPDRAVPPLPSTVGEDLDLQIPRTLESSYVLPDEWYGALESMGLALDKLFMPDIGLTADWDFSRLHWTDTIRHQGQLAPTFAYMVIEDVNDAFDADDVTLARELLVAQNTYNTRDSFVVSRFDKAVTLLSEDGVLMEALHQFCIRPGVAGEWSGPTCGEQEADVAAAAALVPLEQQVALAQAIYGLLAAVELRQEALLAKGKMTMDDWAVQHSKIVNGGTPYDSSVLDGAHPGFDFEQMSRAAQLAVRSVESLRAALTGTDPVPGASFELVGPLGRIAVDLTDQDNTWKHADGFLLVDGHGNDAYYGRVAANASIAQPVSVVLDLEGNDVYAPTKKWELKQDYLVGARLPMQGAGLFGVAILSDAAGDDDYGCLTACQGYGIFGVGVLLDHGGTDQYRGYDFAQGASEFGYGLLVDRGQGNDSYETLQHSQGYGGPRGIGWLVDEGGDDQYVAIAEPIIFDWAGEGTNFSGSQGFAFGFRGGPYWSGGLGALFDLAGNDTYQCAVMCLGFGYFFGTGLFFDQAGNDTYVNTHKYTLGSATHQSVGLFVDGEGKDSYALIGDDEAIGLGYDHGVAYHLDRGDQDDTYTVENIGDFTLGFARHPAIGTLINEGGNDHYDIAGTGEVTCGRSWVDPDDRKGALAKIITLAVFLDLGGTGDIYDIPRDEVGNGKSWHQTAPLGGGWTSDLDFAWGQDSQ
ncbi:MAG: hypothetical protein FJ109_00145 [Deltaproteobacteria bacterium]|nr:hypothetical protein [Deltaproteobacteria bacterium]